jgi:hypothetical protein
MGGYRSNPEMALHHTTGWVDKCKRNNFSSFFSSSITILKQQPDIANYK